MTTLGVIGLGRIGAFHTETLSGIEGVDGLVVADERPDVVAAVAAKHGAKPADSVEELLASGVDGVVVSAATPAHAELTLAAVHRGLPTFCEKPIAATAAESAKVAEVIARSGVPVQVGYQRRFDAAFAAAKRAVDDGSLGLLHTVRSTTMDPAPPPMEYIAGSGGIFRDCAVHDFDVLRWITAFSATASNPATRTCPSLSIRSVAPIRKLQAEVSALRDLSRNMRGPSGHVRIFMRAECNACRSGADNAVREQWQPICNATRLGVVRRTNE